ncbi:hypothetical protein JB92DRAFT_2902687 [Gautieria morchelliformis]|nr:hypothetical protein JB92DRAFT_2902687 [Gautieria morchelliformis]
MTYGREEENYQESGAEGSTTVLPVHARKRYTTALHPLNFPTSIPKINTGSPAKMRLKSRLARAVRPARVNLKTPLPNAFRDVRSRPPLDLGSVHNLDFPLIQRPGKQRLVRPQPPDYPVPSSIPNHSPLKTETNAGYRSMLED